MLPIPISTVSTRSTFQPFLRGPFTPSFKTATEKRAGPWPKRIMLTWTEVKTPGGDLWTTQWPKGPRKVDGKINLTILDFLCQDWSSKNSTFIESVWKLTTVDQPKISINFQRSANVSWEQSSTFLFATVSPFPHRETDPPSPATTLWFKVNESSLMDDEDQKGWWEMMLV